MANVFRFLRPMCVCCVSGQNFWGRARGAAALVSGILALVVLRFMVEAQPVVFRRRQQGALRRRSLRREGCWLVVHPRVRRTDLSVAERAMETVRVRRTDLLLCGVGFKSIRPIRTVRCVGVKAPGVRSAAHPEGAITVAMGGAEPLGKRQASPRRGRSVCAACG